VGIGAGEVGNYGPLLDLNGPKDPGEMFTRIREFMQVMHGVWDSTVEKPFNFNGVHFHVEDAFLSLKPFTKPRPPLYLAALGPRMRQLVGEFADGWCPLTYSPETYEKDWSQIQEYARRAGRNPDTIDSALIAYTTVLGDGERARKMASERGRIDLAARPALLAGLGYQKLAKEFRDLAWSLRKGPATEEISREKESHDQAMNEIPEELTTKVNICGTPDEAIAQIEDYRKAGVRLLILWPPYEQNDALQETIKNYRDKILPYFAHMRDD
jgi:5,10-methylenetetrahydromethanopterin reductase/phthiodiolone/phenolphthiodiolone dimycocerosates ketoreductase